MPLAKGSSKETIAKNIREMIAAGHPQRQAVAAALRSAGVKRKKKKVDMASWDSGKHPRAAKGKGGGRFAKKNGKPAPVPKETHESYSESQGVDEVPEVAEYAGETRGGRVSNELTDYDEATEVEQEVLHAMEEAKADPQVVADVAAAAEKFDRPQEPLWKWAAKTALKSGLTVAALAAYACVAATNPNGLLFDNSMNRLMDAIWGAGNDDRDSDDVRNVNLSATDDETEESLRGHVLLAHFAGDDIPDNIVDGFPDLAEHRRQADAYWDEVHDLAGDDDDDDGAAADAEADSGAAAAADAADQPEVCPFCHESTVVPHDDGGFTCDSPACFMRGVQMNSEPSAAAETPVETVAESTEAAPEPVAMSQDDLDRIVERVCGEMEVSDDVRRRVRDVVAKRLSV